MGGKKKNMGQVHCHLCVHARARHWVPNRLDQTAVRICATHMCSLHASCPHKVLAGVRICNTIFSNKGTHVENGVCQGIHDRNGLILLLQLARHWVQSAPEHTSLEIPRPKN
jgi:hypothetical protein